MIKVAFLDRDGTINVDQTHVYLPEHWQFTPHALEALRSLRDQGFALAVVTNQSGIGHGFYTLEDMQKLHAFMNEQLAEAGIVLNAIAYCPHHRDAGCDCRKPGIGMGKQVEKIVGPIDYPKSWMIGDKVVDMHFGKNLGTHTALIRSEYWHEDELSDKPDIIVDSLYEASVAIQKDTHR